MNAAVDPKEIDRAVDHKERFRANPEQHIYEESRKKRTFKILLFSNQWRRCYQPLGDRVRPYPHQP
jgi:hypothetical protein